MALAAVAAVGTHRVQRRLQRHARRGFHRRGGGTLKLFAYAVPKPGYDKVIPAFNKTDRGKGVQIQQSYGASGDQSRKVKDGAEADIVNFSVEPDITRLVDAGLVDSSWNADANKGIPFGSVVTIVGPQGQPQGHQGLGRPAQAGRRGRHPEPVQLGLGQVEPAGALRRQERRWPEPAGRARLPRPSWSQGHVKMQPKSGREATETFLQGTGDVLLSYENEAIFAERKGDPIEHVDPAGHLQDREPGRGR